MGLQEIALAKEAEVNYGPFSFKWDQFVKSFFMHNKLMYSAMLSGPMEQKQGMMNMGKILELCRFYARDRSPLAWLHAMQIPAILKPLISAIVLSIFTELSMSSRLGEHYRHFAQTIPCLLRRFIIDLRYTSRIGDLYNLCSILLDFTDEGKSRISPLGFLIGVHRTKMFCQAR
jgi:hypothetical protein